MIRNSEQDRRTASAEKGEVRDQSLIKLNFKSVRRPCFLRGGLSRDLKERREETKGSCEGAIWK